MRMIYKDYCLDLLFEENTVSSIQIDSPDMFMSFVKNLWLQFDGEEEHMIFSEDDKEVRLDRVAEIIADPFKIDINNRKILSKIYQGIIELSQETNPEQMMILQSSMEKYIIESCEQSEYPLTYDANPDFAELLKLFGVRVDNNEMDITSRLITYVKLSQRVLNTKLFIFINLRSYFSEEVLNQMIQTICYEKANILLVERFDSPMLDLEKRIIIDKDGCVIGDT